MTLRLALFDVDGTLIDSQNHIFQAMTEAFAAMDRPVPPRAEVLSIVGLSLPQAMARLAPDLPESQADEMVEHYKAAFAGLRVGGGLSPLFPGARGVLDRLSRVPTLLLGLATGKSRRGLDHVLAGHDLVGRFQTEQVADHHPSKPHPAMAMAALAETGVAAADALMIGDTVFDMEMGRSAGMRTLGVAWGYHRVEDLAPHADLIIDSFDTLPEALETLWEARL